jgi:hypothetical protein
MLMSRALSLPFLILTLSVCAAPPPSTGGPDRQADQDVSTAKQNGGNGSSSGEVDEDGNPSNAAPNSAGACAKDLRADLEFLASKDLAGRGPGTPGDQAARKFISDRFKCLGVEPAGPNGSYLQEFTDSEGTSSANVVGMIKGSDPTVGGDIIVVSAHIDHFGLVGNLGLRLGANDNASGIVSVLAVAAAVRQQGTPPKRTIAFMVFGSEELGCEGSHHFISAKTVGPLSMSKVVYDINFDMVGTYAQNGNKVLAHGTFPKTAATSIVKSAIPSGLNVNIGVPGLGQDDSDYSPFCFAGVPVVAFFTDDTPCYHKSCDTADRIDYPHFGQIVKLGADTVLGLAATNTDLAAARRSLDVTDLGCGDDD